MDRRKNEASIEDLCKVLKLALPNGVSAAFKAMSMEELAQEHEELLKELLLLTCRPNAKWLHTGLRKAFQKLEPELASDFSKKLHEAATYCFEKFRSQVEVFSSSQKDLQAPRTKAERCVRQLKQDPLHC